MLWGFCKQSSCKNRSLSPLEASKYQVTSSSKTTVIGSLLPPPLSPLGCTSHQPYQHFYGDCITKSSVSEVRRRLPKLWLALGLDGVNTAGVATPKDCLSKTEYPSKEEDRMVVAGGLVVEWLCDPNTACSSILKFNTHLTHSAPQLYIWFWFLTFL